MLLSRLTAEVPAQTTVKGTAAMAGPAPPSTCRRLADLDMQQRQGQARPNKARQRKAKQGKARQGKARQGKARQGQARQGKARQGW